MLTPLFVLLLLLGLKEDKKGASLSAVLGLCSPLQLAILWTHSGPTLTIGTVHFFGIVEKVNHVKNQVDRIPIHTWSKRIYLEKHGLGTLDRTHAQLMFFKINAFGSGMNWYPINLIFYMVDFLDDPEKMNGSDGRCGPGMGPQNVQQQSAVGLSNSRQADSY